MSRLEEIEERMRKATEGPWELRDKPGTGKQIFAKVDCGYDKNGKRLLPIYDVSIRPSMTVGEDGFAYVVLSYESWYQFPSENFKEKQLANADFIAHSREDIEWLLGEVERLQKEKAPLYTDRIKDLEKHVKKLSHRRCFQCKHEDYYVLNTLPHCKCAKCGSADTRVIKEKI